MDCDNCSGLIAWAISFRGPHLGFGNSGDPRLCVCGEVHVHVHKVQSREGSYTNEDREKEGVLALTSYVLVTLVDTSSCVVCPQTEVDAYSDTMNEASNCTNVFTCVLQWLGFVLNL